MKANKLDNNIKEKLQNRTFQPSASAWERLSIKLDEQPMQKKRGWFFYIGIAASILVLVSIGIQLLSNKTEEIKPNKIIVDTPIDKNTIDSKIDKLVSEIPLEETIVKADEVEEKIENGNNDISGKIKKVILNKEKSKNLNTSSIINKKVVIAQVNKKEIEVIKTQDVILKEEPIKVKTLKQNPNSRIKINSDDLLFAVTHSSQEVKEYYAKYNVSREDVIKTIKSELNKTNIKVNPNAILAEVERNIGEEDFQNNFLQSLKKRVTNIATAIASRND